MKTRVVLILTLQIFSLVPGENAIPAEFHYEPDNANDTVAQSFLSDFIQSGDTLPLFINGDESSSPFPSLVQALEGVSLSTRLDGTSDTIHPANQTNSFSRP